jgi:hypothetical protein
MSDQNRNTYCKRLGIAVPRPEELLGQRELKLFELTVVVLLEYGGPMSPTTCVRAFRPQVVKRVPRICGNRYCKHGVGCNQSIGMHRASLA